MVPRPGSRNHGDPLSLALRCMAIALAAVALSLMLPGAIAAVDGVFYDSGVRAKLPHQAALRLEQFEAQKAWLIQSIASLQSQLDSIHDTRQEKDFDFYLHLLEARKAELTGLQPPIFVLGFFLNPQMLLWPAIYTGLGCLLFAFRTPPLRSLPGIGWKFPAIGLFIYFYYEWPLWVRNFLLGQHGRTIFAYTNFDIDPGSFFAQEATIAGFAFLLAAVWIRWTLLARTLDREDSVGANRSEPYLDTGFVFRLQNDLSIWVMASVALGLGFAYFTTFFWSLVAHYHDQRYILSAFLAHSLWAITWILLSVPLVKTWMRLKKRRLQAIEDLLRESQHTPGQKAELTLADLEKLESLVGLRISIAGAGAVISLLLPIVQLFLHK